MYTFEYLSELAQSQHERFFARDLGVPRQVDVHTARQKGFATIITGVRRCGKSTLLRQLAGDDHENSFFFNFEDIRLSAFDSDDFVRLTRVIGAENRTRIFLDEVQVVLGWERFVRQMLDDGLEVYVTGSNASMLSQELGTRLTGRHLPVELFPFSFSEYCLLRESSPSQESLERYLRHGGFPDYARTENPLLIQQLTDDILHRDIAVRYGIRDVNTLRQLAGYMFANTSRPFSATRLATQLPIKAVSTVLEYIDHLEAAYLILQVPKFSHSEKARLRNPRKAYCIDPAIVTHATLKTTDDLGRKLENLIYLHLRRKYKRVFYFGEQHECDFIAFGATEPAAVVQVCYTLNENNLNRELDGAFAALSFFGLSKAVLVTLNQNDCFTRGNQQVDVIAAHQFIGEAL